MKKTGLSWDKIRAIHRFLPETSEGWHQHKNGFGWVKDGVDIADSVYVGERAVFHDGVFYGGVFHGGEFHGGVFYGGVFHGGVFHGGVIKRTPLYMFLKYTANESAQGRIQIGCKEQAIEDWEARTNKEWREKGYTNAERDVYKAFVEMVKKYQKVCPLDGENK